MQALGNLAGGQSSRSAASAALGGGVYGWVVAVSSDYLSGQAHGFMLLFLLVSSRGKPSSRKTITDLAVQIGSAVNKNVMYPRLRILGRGFYFPRFFGGIFLGVGSYPKNTNYTKCLFGISRAVILHKNWYR